MTGKMTPEKARELRDEVRKGHPRHHPAPYAPQPETQKRRQLLFSAVPPDQASQAGSLLKSLEGMEVALGPKPNSLSVMYDLRNYTLQGLERALIQQGFTLSDTLYLRLRRAVLYYSEETQLRNMRMPERLLKKSHEIYSRAWDKHPHGDHDDTPPDLRQDR